MIKKTLVPAIIIAALFFVANFILLKNGHFHEDAYILFVYVNNMINGYGITFYQSGPPIEGATDFLWLIMLFSIARIGLDVGTAAILLNSIGVLMICQMIIKELNSNVLKNNFHLAFAYLLSFLWVVQSPLIAALGGFSVFLYMAFILLAFTMVKDEKNISWIPIVSLVIALFRPDGVIIGFGFAILGLMIAKRKLFLSRYLSICLFSFAVSLSYFGWRYYYFGNLLPLPLYVKSHGSTFTGLGISFSWIKSSVFILVPAIVLAGINKRLTRYAIISFPLILLFLALLTATQSQNVGFRFQAPILIVAYFILASELMKLVDLKSSRNKIILAALIVSPSIFMGIKNIYSAKKDIVQFSYINQVAFEINKVLTPGSTIALTEAGRLAYWNQNGKHKIIDLVGLNSPFPAMNTISANYIKQLSPDMLMFHQNNLLDYTEMTNDMGDVILVSDELFKSVQKESSFEGVNLERESKVFNAAYSSTQFLRENFDSYDVFFVKYGLKYDHIYAFKKDLDLTAQIRKALEKSFEVKNKAAYYDYSANPH
jgi:hypothetical protein